ncbi:plant UBX domain-containing protein 1 [Selaginella moellendorffii]|uniref:plant UBX domain-containing protein 1 n=1 Tax=Selaginella moellendorffii TaxID=88036 RepID=UPI000D1CB474|nr:plant UBX domain-containing protein 1 [Selaginella moellendorffii]|eukprot:XP_024518664.1 plant UBX domain-containing protein 1 [Selaginella moellendorffii]
MASEAHSSPGAWQQSLAAVRSLIGRDLRVFVNPAALEAPIQHATGKEEAESDEFYELTPEDYARLVSKKREERFLKTAKIRDAEAAARRSKFAKATLRVQFPDSIIVEADFSPLDLVVELVTMLEKLLLKPEIPFHLYTTPPKQILKDYNVTMYDAGLVPGALVYLSYNNDFQGPYLKEIVLASQHSDEESKDQVLAPPAGSPPRVASPEETRPSSQQTVPVGKGSKPRPKWLKLGK